MGQHDHVLNLDGVRFDSEGVRFKPNWPIPEMRLTWGRVVGLRRDHEMVRWTDDEGRALSARASHRKTVKAEVDRRWGDELVRRMRKEGRLDCEHLHGRQNQQALRAAARIATGVALALLAGAVHLGLSGAPSSALGLLLEVSAIAILGLASLTARQRERQREVDEATALRFAPEGLSARDQRGRWQLVLSSCPLADRRPGRWRRVAAWLGVGSPTHGLAGIPYLLLIGWSRRAGVREPPWPEMDPACWLRRVGLRTLLLWTPAAAGIGAGFALLPGGTSTPPMLLAAGMSVIPFALGSFLLVGAWLSRHSWAAVSAEADELLARLGW